MNFLVYSMSTTLCDEYKDFVYYLISGVARAVAGVAKATTIFPVLFSKFGKKIG